MLNKLVVIIHSLKVTKIKKILLNEMNFFCTKLQLPPELLTRGVYRPQIPVLSVLCPQLNLLNPPPPNKIPAYATAYVYKYIKCSNWMHSYKIIPYAYSSVDVFLLTDQLTDFCKI